MPGSPVAARLRQALVKRGWGRRSLAQLVPVPGPETGRPRLNSLCHTDFWDDGEWRGYSRALGLPQDEGWYHRKAWEWSQCVYGLERLGALGPAKTALGVGAGHERVLYYLANRTALTVGTDLYAGDFATSAAEEADPSFLWEPERFAPFAYRRQHLVGLPADGCRLPFKARSFDVVYSLSSIEHFGGHERASEAVQEMCRVLKPGGVACIATELVIEGGEHPAYFTMGHFRQFVLEASGLSLAEPLDERLPPAQMVADPVKVPEEYQRTPHIVLQDGKWKFTSVCVFMVKPTDGQLAHAGGRRLASAWPRARRRAGP
jgi:SAM-dependent methyltransferase